MQNVSMQPNLEALQQAQGVAQQSDVSAFANQNISLESTPVADTFQTTQEAPKKSNKGLLLGLAAAAVAVGAFCVLKGKTPQGLQKQATKLMQAGKADAAEITQDAAKKISDSGKALLNSADDILKHQSDSADDLVKLGITITKGEDGVLTFAQKLAEVKDDAGKITQAAVDISGTKSGIGVEAIDKIQDLCATSYKGELDNVIVDFSKGDKSKFFKFTKGELSTIGKGVFKDNSGIYNAKIQTSLFPNDANGYDALQHTVGISNDFPSGKKTAIFTEDKLGYFNEFNKDGTVKNSLDLVRNEAKIGKQAWELKDDKWIKKAAEDVSK